MRRVGGIDPLSLLTSTLTNATAEEQQVAFYKSVAGNGLKDTLAQIETFVSLESHEESYVCDGEYLPLSVWQVRGFDASLIERHAGPEDILQHDKLGPIYRLKLPKFTEKRTRGAERRSTLSMNAVPKRKLCDEPEEPQLAIEDGAVESAGSSSSSSSSSSSTSSSRNKSKKDKTKSKKSHKKSKKQKKKAKKSKKDEKDKKEPVRTNGSCPSRVCSAH